AAGHEVAWNQLAVPMRAASTSRRAPRATESQGVVDVDTSPQRWRVRAGNTSFTVNRELGQLADWRVRGRELITRGPQLNVWRAPTDNDGLKLFAVVNWGGAKFLTDSLKAGYDRIELSDTQCRLETARDGSVQFVVTQRWLCPG